MKKQLIVTAAVGITLIFTACARPEQRIEPTSPAERVSQAETEKEPTLTAQNEADQSQSEYFIITGAIEDISEDFSSVTIQPDDSQDSITLNIAAADLELTRDLTVGYEITAVCSASDQTAIILADRQAEPAISQAKGIVVSQAMSTFSIEQENGERLNFIKNNTEGLTSDVLGEAVDENNGTNTQVCVTYINIVYGENTSTFVPIRTQRAEN